MASLVDTFFKINVLSTKLEVGHEHDALVAAALERRANEAVDLLSSHYRKTGALVGEALAVSGRGSRPAAEIQGA
jgi:DNA-binding GntR family transcriptional regulator